MLPEMGVAGEIIEKSKKVREVVNSRIVSTITSIAAYLAHLSKQ